MTRTLTVLASLLALVSSTSFAGSKISSPIVLAEGSGSGTISGQLGTVRNWSLNPNPAGAIEFLSCSVTSMAGYSTEEPLVYCAGGDAYGKVLSCYTYSSAFATVLATVNSDSYISISANKAAGSYSGQGMICASIKVENASYYEPKQP